MSLIRKTPTAPSLDEQAASASATAAAALSIFQVAADDLATSTTTLRDVAAAKHADAVRLLAESNALHDQADATAAQASAIRNLLGGAA